MMLLVIFTIGYMVGGFSALLLIGLMLAGRRERRTRGIVVHDA
jgi:hypothetical protein